MKFKIITSNKNKLKEFKQIIPEIEAISGKDLKEIKADKDLVILHKAKDLNQENIIVEDTIIEIYQKNKWIEVVDIKYKLRELKSASKARWITSLAYLSNGKIKVFRGTTEGLIDPTRELLGFGFDNFFIPEGSKQSLYELGDEKDQYSARKKALINLKNNKVLFKKDIKQIDKWTGDYQS